VISVPLFSLFFNVPVLPYLLPLIALIALATVGFVAVGTFVQRHDRADALCRAPAARVVAAVHDSAAVVGGGRDRPAIASRPLSEILGWLNMLAVYDIVFVTLALLLFPATVNE